MPSTAFRNWSLTTLNLSNRGVLLDVKGMMDEYGKDKQAVADLIDMGFTDEDTS